MPWKETTTMEQKIEPACRQAGLFVNGELENIPSQNYVKILKSQDPPPINL
jgi:hypothetical protein